MEFSSNYSDVNAGGRSLRVLRLVPDTIEGNVPIVFLHDSFGSIKLWRTFPHEVAKGRQCEAVLYDRQGHAESPPFSEARTVRYMNDDAEILLELLEKLIIGKCILFGHSDGGTIALLAAAMKPEAFEAVIAEGAHVFVEERTIEGIKNSVKAYATTSLRQSLEKYHGEKADALFHAWADTWLAPWYRDWTIENVLHQIRCPVMAMQGINDEYGTERQVDAIVSQVAGPSFKCMIPDAGHTPHKEQPAATLAAVLEFLDRLPNST